ncbi:MAG: HNH endonuclease [Gaiellaceae bacterium]
MRVPWIDERCILCLGTPHSGIELTQRSDAHVIPRAIGGKLSALFLCRGCNARMGRFEAILAQDISVRLLLDKLEDQNSGQSRQEHPLSPKLLHRPSRIRSR